jgi:hypothetical protein
MGFDDYDPFRVVAAVSALQGLPADEVFQALTDAAGDRSDGACSYGLFWVLRVLFDLPAEVGYPPVRIGQPSIPPPDDADLIPRFPIAIVLDVPLLVVDGYVLGGLPEPVEGHISFFRNHGAIRQHPLAPSMEPSEIEKDLLALWRRAYGDRYLNQVTKTVRTQLRGR